MVYLTKSICVLFLIWFPFIAANLKNGRKLIKRVNPGRPLLGNERKLSFRGRGFRTVTVAARHDNVVLECEAGGSPPPTVHWLKDGQRINQGAYETVEDDSPLYEDSDTDEEESLGKLRLSATKSRLYLDCITGNSEGEYTCVAETPFMRKSQSTVIKVVNSEYPSNYENCIAKRSMRGEPARIYMWTSSRLEMEDKTVQLFCRASGTPEPEITWYDQLNNTLPDDSMQYHIAPNGDLIIRDISWLNNMGSYRCSAANMFGSQSVETFLYPTPKEDPFRLPV